MAGRVKSHETRNGTSGEVFLEPALEQKVSKLTLSFSSTLAAKVESAIDMSSLLYNFSLNFTDINSATVCL